MLTMPKGFHHLTRDLRCQIDALKKMGISQRGIAKIVNISASTVSREIKRNAIISGYCFDQADKKAQERRSRASQTSRKMTPEFIAKIRGKLNEHWSPEQIAGRFKLEGLMISHETIYRYIWDDKQKGGRLFRDLRHHGKRYNKRSSSKPGRGCIPHRVDIKERPAIVELKSRIGDWEGDTIIGANHQGAILSYVDRHSKFTLLKKLDRRTAENVKAATIDKMAELPHQPLTITYDNGKEFSEHLEIGETLDAKCYFATPYHSWERGLNEHTNGLVRQYVPKSSDLQEVSDEKIQKIENHLNNRPRKVLKYRTPFEVFYGQQPVQSCSI